MTRADPLHDAMEGYSKRLHALYVPGTVNAWQSYAIELHRFLSEQGIKTTDGITLSVFDDYMTGVAARHPGSTASAKLTFLRNFGNYLKLREYTDGNIAEDLKNSDYKINTGESMRSGGQADAPKPYLKRPQVKQLWENPPKPRLRNELMLKVLWQTGMRRHEIGLIDKDAPEKVAGKPLWKVQIRSNKTSDGEFTTRNVYIRDDLKLLWDLWRDDYRPSIKSAYRSDKMFITNKSKAGRGITGNAVNEMVKNAAKNAGLQEEIGTDVLGRTHYFVTAHTIRHSTITYLANHTSVKLTQIKELAGHDSLSTTSLYLHKDDEAIEAALAANPF